MPDSRRFVILAVPRSGSNLLCSLLHSHPDILCHHELYNPNGVYYALPLRNGEFSFSGALDKLAQRDADPLAFLDRVWQTNLDHSQVGFKMTLRQNESVFEKVLHDPQVKKIVLRRRNTVKTYVSKLIAENDGIWEDWDTDRQYSAVSTSTTPEQTMQQVKRQAVTVDWRLLSQDIQSNQQFYQTIYDTLSETKQTACQVDYETLMDSSTQRRLLEFLGVSDQSLSTLTRKQNSSDLRDLIVNYDQLLEQCDSDELLQQLRALS